MTNVSTPAELLLSGRQIALKRDIWDDPSVDQIVQKILDLFGLDIPNWQDAVANFDELRQAFEGTYTGSDPALILVQSVISTITSLATGKIDPARITQIFLSQLSSDDSDNMLENGGFKDAVSLIGEGVWTYDEAVGRTSLGSARATGTGEEKVLTSNLVECSQGQKFDATAYVQWSGVSGSGSRFELQLRAYNSAGAIVSTQMIANVTSSPASGGWTAMHAQWPVPAGVTGVRLRVVVKAAVTAGQVWFDDADLHKVGSTLPQEWVAGLTAQINAFTSDIQSNLTALLQIGQILQGNVVTAINDGVQDFKDWFSDLLGWQTTKAAAIDDTSMVAMTAQAQADNAKTVAVYTNYNLVTNRPLWMSQDPTAEVTFPWSEMAYITGGTVNTIPVTSIWRMAKMRITQDAVMNTLSFLVQKTGTAGSGLYVYLFKRDSDAGRWNQIWASDNLFSAITTAVTKQTVEFAPEGYPVTAGELYGIMFSETHGSGGGGMNFGSKTFPPYFTPGLMPTSMGAASTVGAYRDVTYTDSQINALNDSNVIYVEMGSDIGQVEALRNWYENFDGGTFNGWVLKKTGADNFVISENKRVSIGGSFNDGWREAIYGNQTLTDKQEAQALLVDGTSTTRVGGIGICNTADGIGGVFLLQTKDDTYLARMDSLGGHTLVATATGQGGTGYYKVRYDPSSNTFTGWKSNSGGASTFVQIPGLSWTDSSNTVSHGFGRKFGAIVGVRNLAFNSCDVDSFYLRDW